MPSDIVFDGCAVIAFIALEPGGLLLFLSQKSNQKARKKIIYVVVSIEPCALRTIFLHVLIGHNTLMGSFSNGVIGW